MILCKHCGEPIPLTLKGEDFCCSGCEAAYRLIQSANLQSYYDKRVLESDVRALIPEETGKLLLDSYVLHNEKDIATAHFMVDGIHCAACVWVIETLLGKQKGVVQARMNMTTKRLTLKWHAHETSGEKLVDVVHKIGYRLQPYDPEMFKSATQQQEKSLLLAMAVSGFTAANVMLFSISLWAGGDVDTTTKSFLQWYSALIVLPSTAYAGQVFFKSAIKGVLSRHMNMDVPISIAILITLGISYYDMVTGVGETYFESAAMLLFFLLIGRYLDMRVRGKSKSAAEQLFTMQATTATVEKDGQLVTLPVNDVQVGDVVIVPKGARIPVDGVVVHGQSTVDTSLMTGESLPRDVVPQMKVFAGYVNVGNVLKIEATAVGKATNLAHISQLVDESTQLKNKYTRIADRAARIYAPMVHLLAAITFTYWYVMTGQVHQSALYATAVLIVTCPCALALAVPTVQVVAVSRLLKMGVILKSATALERLKDIKNVVFDKTGTLTTGQFQIKNMPSATHLAIAAGMAKNSSHPLAKAIVQKMPKAPLINDVKEHLGLGLSTVIDGKSVKLGSRQFCGIQLNKPAQASEVWLKVDGEEPSLFDLRDTVRPDAENAVTLFKKAGLDVSLVSGDTVNAVEPVASTLGISNWQADAMPEDKYKILQNMENPLMIGDGINDAPSLAAAHVGITLGQGADIAKTGADVILQNNKLADAYTTWRLAQKTDGLVRMNFMLSLGYNGVSVPLAMAGYITPLWAAVFMSASSVTVVLNAMRLTKVDIK